ncbi:MAG: peroxiredoxin-like family protein [Wenzhouxiangellaceae bacterium]
MRYLCVALWMTASAAFAQIHPSADQVRPLLPGMHAPRVQFIDSGGNTVRLDPEKMRKPVVLTFYRGGWCPYCNLHLAELRGVEAELRRMGFEVWFASPDRPELLVEGDQAGLGYRLLSDPGLKAAQAFGIAFRLDTDTVERLAQSGMDINARASEPLNALPVPATFLIGTDGVIQFSYVNPDYTVRLDPEVLKAAASAWLHRSDRRLKTGKPR